MNTTRYERLRYAVVRASVWTSSWRIAAASARRSSVVCKGSPCRGRGSRIVAIAASSLRRFDAGVRCRPNLRCRAPGVHRLRSEQRQELVEAADLHGNRRPEPFAPELQVGMLDRHSARADLMRADDLVAELARDAER